MLELLGKGASKEEPALQPMPESTGGGPEALQRAMESVQGNVKRTFGSVGVKGCGGRERLGCVVR